MKNKFASILILSSIFIISCHDAEKEKLKAEKEKLKKDLQKSEKEMYEIQKKADKHRDNIVEERKNFERKQKNFEVDKQRAMKEIREAEANRIAIDWYETQNEYVILRCNKKIRIKKETLINGYRAFFLSTFLQYLAIEIKENGKREVLFGEVIYYHDVPSIKPVHDLDEIHEYAKSSFGFSANAEVNIYCFPAKGKSLPSVEGWGKGYFSFTDLKLVSDAKGELQHFSEKTKFTIYNNR